MHNTKILPLKIIINKMKAKFPFSSVLKDSKVIFSSRLFFCSRRAIVSSPVLVHVPSTETVLKQVNLFTF